MRAGRFEATCLVQARCTVTVVNLSWSGAAPVALRTMLPPMRSTMSELLAWAKEARCPDTDWRPPCDSAEVRGRHRLELLRLLYGQLKRVCYHMQQNEAEFRRHRRCCAKNVCQGGVLLHDWLILAADAPKEESRPRYHRMWGVSNKEARLRLERLHDAYHDAVMPGAGWSETSVGFDTRIAVTAGTGNCLRATRMLVPEFNRASRANKVGKLLEAATRPQLDPFGVGAHLSVARCAVEQGYRAGQGKRGPRRRRRTNGTVPLCTELARLCRACIQLSLAFVFQVSCHSSGLPRSGHFSGSGGHDLGNPSFRNRGNRQATQ